MQGKRYALVERIYGSVSAAKAAWAEETLRAQARQAAWVYSRTGQMPQVRLFGSDRAPRQGRR